MCGPSAPERHRCSGKGPAPGVGSHGGPSGRRRPTRPRCRLWLDIDAARIPAHPELVTSPPRGHPRCPRPTSRRTVGPGGAVEGGGGLLFSDTTIDFFPVGSSFLECKQTPNYWDFSYLKPEIKSLEHTFAMSSFRVKAFSLWVCAAGRSRPRRPQKEKTGQTGSVWNGHVLSVCSPRGSSMHPPPSDTRRKPV